MIHRCLCIYQRRRFRNKVAIPSTIRRGVHTAFGGCDGYHRAGGITKKLVLFNFESRDTPYEYTSNYEHCIISIYRTANKVQPYGGKNQFIYDLEFSVLTFIMLSHCSLTVSTLLLPLCLGRSRHSSTAMHERRILMFSLSPVVLPASLDT